MVIPIGYIKQSSLATSLEQSKENRYEVLMKDAQRMNSMPSLWAELSVVITGLATSAILSYTRVLPAAVLSTMKLAAVTTTSSIVLATICIRNSEDTPNTRDQKEKPIEPIRPFHHCVSVPILEELFFRGFLQGGVSFVLNRLFAPVMITFFGVPMTAASAAAGVIAGCAFGFAHHFFNNNKTHFQAIKTTLTGIVIYPRLYNLYGLWATCLWHITNNTITLIPIACVRSLATSPSQDALDSKRIFDK